MNLYKKWIQRCKENDRLKRREDLKAEFQIKEIGKEFYITHNGVAIYQFTPVETSADMAERLSRIRMVAIMYDDIKNK